MNVGWTLFLKERANRRFLPDQNIMILAKVVAFCQGAHR